MPFTSQKKSGRQRLAHSPKRKKTMAYRIQVKGQVSAKPGLEPLPSGKLPPTEDIICLMKNRAALSDGAGGTGVYAHLWAQQLTQQLPAQPFTDSAALWQYVQQQEEPFLQVAEPLAATHAPSQYKLWKEGSAASLVALWWKRQYGRMVAEWVTYGDSALMIYEPHKHRLYIQPYLQAPESFLRNPHLLNWNAEGLPAVAFCRSLRPVPLHGKIVLMASDALAQHLYWLYLNTTPEGCQQLDAMLVRYPEAAPTVHALREFARQRRFIVHLMQLQKSLDSPKAFADFCSQLHDQQLLRKDDYALVWLQAHINKNH
jgi:hypothetical protein